MIDYLKHMAIFTRVAEKGSFSETARSLGMAPSRVSESVSKLEDYLGTTLLNRTTRKVSLTSEGRRLYIHTSAFLQRAERGLDELNSSKSKPVGELVISTPSYLSSSSLAKGIGKFVEENSQVSLSVSYTDHDVEPLKDRFDMCIRGGNFKHDGFTVRDLGEIRRVLVVGKGYYSSREEPKHPSDLNDWEWINYRHYKRNYNFRSSPDEAITLSIGEQSRLRVDNFDALLFFTKMNLGVTVMPEEYALSGIAEGSLVSLLDSWHLTTARYSAIWPDQSNHDSLITVFVDYLTEFLSQ